MKEILQEFDEFLLGTFSEEGFHTPRTKEEWVAFISEKITAAEKRGYEAGKKEQQDVIDIALENLEACVLLMSSETERGNLMRNVYSVLAAKEGKV